MDDRRQEKRLTWAAKVKIEEPTTRKVISADSRLRNITKHGFGFVSEDHVTWGAVYKFTMTLSTSSFEVNARIVHFHIETTYYVCGAKIESLSLLQRSRINHFLASKAPELQRKFMIYAVVAGGAVAAVVKLFAGVSIAVAVTIFFAIAIGSFLLLPF
jgi:hypothetical protein